MSTCPLKSLNKGSLRGAHDTFYPIRAKNPREHNNFVEKACRHFVDTNWTFKKATIQEKKTFC